VLQIGSWDASSSDDGGPACQAVGERVVAFRRIVDQSHRRAASLKDHIDNIFQSVFSHRFRDVSADIRVSVIEAVGGWMKLLPSIFLSDQYLKYLAWALSDKVCRSILDPL
jgi:cohesin complex subunit SA-1/2